MVLHFDVLQECLQVPLTTSVSEVMGNVPHNVHRLLVATDSSSASSQSVATFEGLIHFADRL